MSAKHSAPYPIATDLSAPAVVVLPIATQLLAPSAPEPITTPYAPVEAIPSPIDIFSTSPTFAPPAINPPFVTLSAFWAKPSVIFFISSELSIKLFTAFLTISGVT